MKGNRAAQRYAKAILGLAKDQNAADAVHGDMQDILDTVKNSKDLKDMLASPVIKNGLKKSTLLEIFKNLNGVTKGSLDLLIDNSRIAILDLVAQHYILKYNEANKVQEAIVTTAVPLNDELQQVVMAKVKELTGEEASLRQVIDEDIIGGFVLKVGDLQYDASIARKFSNLKKKFKDNTYISKI